MFSKYYAMYVGVHLLKYEKPVRLVVLFESLRSQRGLDNGKLDLCMCRGRQEKAM